MIKVRLSGGRKERILDLEDFVGAGRLGSFFVSRSRRLAGAAEGYREPGYLRSRLGRTIIRLSRAQVISV